MNIKTAADRVNKIVDAPCPSCGGVRSHTIRGAYDSSWDVGQGEMHGGAEHDLLECNGCHTGVYRCKSWSTEEPGGPATEYFPSIISDRDLRKPKDFDYLTYGTPVETVYRQTITAFNQELRTLAGAGVRLLIEGICNEQKIAKGPVTDKNGKTKSLKNLEGRINGMVEQGLIAKRQAATLHEIRFLGNDAAHDLDNPSREVLRNAIEIVEHVMAQVYEQPEQAKRLAARKRPEKH